MKRDGRELAAKMEAMLRGRLGAGLRLVPFETGSAKVVFRAELASGKRLFVKLVRTDKGLAQKRLADELALPFVARVLHLLPWDGEHSVMCQEWQEGRHVLPEDMTDRQCASLIAATMRLQSALKPRHAMLPPQDLEKAFAVVADFARRHPLMRPLLASLLELPPAERTFPAAESLAVIHGDQHYENYLFDGEEVGAIMDFEAVTRGLRTQDFAYAVMRRLFKARLSAGKQARLAELLARMFEAAGAPPEERALAINMWRIVFAARRLASHPHFGPVALLVWKRDLPLRRLLAAARA